MATVETPTTKPDGAAGSLSPKARRTRESLIKAARVVFSRDGFVDARISDITAQAGMAYGTFYTYFDSKEAIFREVILRLHADLLADPDHSPFTHDDPGEQVEHANRRFVKVYHKNASLMAALEQVATFSSEMRELRREVRQPFVQRNSRAIKGWQVAGLADPHLDPKYAATALGAMVDRFMYVWMVLGEDFDEDKAVVTLSRMWLNALGITPPPPKPARRTTTHSTTTRSRPSKRP